MWGDNWSTPHLEERDETGEMRGVRTEERAGLLPAWPGGGFLQLSSRAGGGGLPKARICWAGELRVQLREHVRRLQFMFQAAPWLEGRA